MDALRLMTFNLRRDTPVDGANRWDARRDAALAVVRAAAPHVLATQEGLARQLAALDAGLPAHRRVGGCRRGDGSEEHMALYYDATRLDLLAWGDFWLSDTPHVPGSATWGNDLPRMATWARLLDRTTEERVLVASTHLDHRSAVARERSARALAERLPDAFLLGDFNSRPGDATHRAFLAEGLVDAHVAHADPDDPAPTFHGFSDVPRDRIDWVLAPPQAEVLSHVVVRDRPGGRYPSDHDPVVVDVRAQR